MPICTPDTLIKPAAIVRVLVVGHTLPAQNPPTIPLHMSWEFHIVALYQCYSSM